MKKTFLFMLVVLIPALNCLADCYDSGNVFDGRGTYGEGTLCRFGEQEGEILPYYQRRETSPTDYLYSQKEEMAMLKSVVNRGRYGNDGPLRNAVNSAARPLRQFRSRQVVGWGF